MPFNKGIEKTLSKCHQLCVSSTYNYYTGSYVKLCNLVECACIYFYEF